jgi:exopolyphosphatase / guanosine-5'-triphosphate,3'-diphosphate pyrophosphatase
VDGTLTSRDDASAAHGVRAAPRAAIDVGSNSVRLLVVDAAGARLTREMTITRLGTGVDATGHLDDQALARTLETIARYRDIWTEHGVTDRVRIAATSAVRDASDRDRFFDGVREVTGGVDAEVLSGAEEAALAFAGAAGAVEVERPTAVIDIGGGSTELIVGSADGGVASSVSLQLGCVRVTERHLHDDPPTIAQIEGARAMVAEQLDLADRVLGEQGVGLGGAMSLVGVAGTSTTLGALHLGLEDYLEEAIHGTRVPASSLVRLCDDLVGLPSSARAALGPMQPGREDVIHGGALVLAGVVERYAFAEVAISEADNLDGLVASLA